MLKKTDTNRGKETVNKQKEGGMKQKEWDDKVDRYQGALRLKKKKKVRPPEGKILLRLTSCPTASEPSHAGPSRMRPSSRSESSRALQESSSSQH